ncbi:MAG: glycosyltransferase [Oscillospiraceae bacterium]|nr:glycosyltransferase [Oscillospiraceae bacterium]
MKIAFFAQDLGAGGIQKSLYNMLRNLDYSQVEAELFLFEEGCFFPEPLPEALEVRVLPKPPRICSFLPFDLARKLWHPDWTQYGPYDVAADFNSYQFSCACGALGVPAKRRVQWIHNNVEIKLQNEWKYRVLWHFFKGKQKYYDGFVPCSAALKEPFIRASGRADAEYTVIANYIDVPEIRRKQAEDPGELGLSAETVNVVALGRLCHQKGYDIMIRLFAEAARIRDDLRLYIIGDGEDRETLEAQAKKEAPGKIIFLGAQANPYAIMARMDAFLSTSRYEGQPLNVEEARAIGLPLYCSKNLEAYSEGLRGYEEKELVRSLSELKREEKHPDDLKAYNDKILRSIKSLAES